MVLLKFKGLEKIEDVEIYKNCYLEIDRARRSMPSRRLNRKADLSFMRAKMTTTTAETNAPRKEICIVVKPPAVIGGTKIASIPQRAAPMKTKAEYLNRFMQDSFNMLI